MKLLNWAIKESKISSPAMIELRLCNRKVKEAISENSVHWRQFQHFCLTVQIILSFLYLYQR